MIAREKKNRGIISGGSWGLSSQLKIGISAKFHDRAPVFYGEAKRHIQYLETSLAKWVANNGALPFMIPSESSSTEIVASSLNPRGFAQELDALILQGGVDIHPELYGQPLNGPSLFPTDIVRDRYELVLIKAFIDAKKPVLGICRGMQLINVFCGGTLHSDLETKGFGKHLDRSVEGGHSHTVRVLSDSVLSNVYSGEGQVISVHHQGIEKLGEGLSIEALSTDDELIEAISLVNDEKFILAVQWHPEFHENQKDYFDANDLLKVFVRVAKNRKFYGTFSLDRRTKIGFSKSVSLTLGAELELQIVDPESFDLTPKAKLLIDQLKGKTEKIKGEIFQSMLEIETDICPDANAIEKDLLETHRILMETAEAAQVLIGSAGTHPFAKTSDRSLSPNNRRYLEIMRQKQWVARRISIFGLHCHVGVHSPQEGIDLYRFYLSIAPLLLGLSVSSPFFESENTGLYSMRSTFFESTPAGGHPPILNSWIEFEGLMAKLLTSGAISSHKDLWWDVRPSLNYGTIEVRICDSMPTLKENVALIAFIHLLGHVYLNSPDFKQWPTLADWSYRENKWRALRYGANFEFIINDQGSTVSSKEYLLSLIEEFSSVARDFGYTNHMQLITTQLLNTTPADRMLKAYSSSGELQEVVRLYCQEFKTHMTTIS